MTREGARIELFCLKLPSASGYGDLPNSLLTDTENREACELLAGGAREQFILARSFVRACLANALGTTAASVQIDRRGKPKLSRAAHASAIDFSVAKTEGLVVCALCDAGPIGVDAEHLGRKVAVLPVADRYFSERESAALKTLTVAQRRQRFFELWVLKEAHAKAIGLGLALPLDHCTFEFDSGLSIDASGGDRDWCYSLIQPSAEHLLALAVPRCLREAAVRQMTYVTAPARPVESGDLSTVAPRLEYFALVEEPLERRAGHGV